MNLGKFRSFFWPVYAGEYKKFIPMFFLFFLISFNYNALRSCKDTLIITAHQSGAEAIPFIKVWAILPAAFLFTYFFTKWANRWSLERVFYVMMSIFLGFFVLFIAVLLPFQESLHLHGLSDRLQEILPEGCKGLIAIFRNWTFTLFYVMSELWGTVILTVLFWGFANAIMNINEAKRYYGMLMIGANIAGTLSGLVAVWLSKIPFLPQIPYGTCNWDQSLLFLCGLIVVAGVGTIAIFRWLYKRQKVHFEVPVEKEKVSLRSSFAYLAKSKYLLCIALIVLTYNVAINLIEVVWKNQIKELYPSPTEYNVYMGEVMTIMGVIATFASLMTVWLIRYTSWRFSALIAPVMTIVTGGIFFTFVLFQDSLTWIGGLLHATPLFLSVWIGCLQNCFTRACKYTVFDATKEMAFIPLSTESKLKGKAAIDGVGSRIGKSGGAVIHQSLLLVFSTVAACTPFVAVIFMVVVCIWIMSVFSLSKQFEKVTENAQVLEVR